MASAAPAMSLPGYVGFPVIGDKSVEFYKDPVAFVEKRIRSHKSWIFSSRFLNKPTVFVASNAGVKELLNDHAGDIELGYKAFMHQIYGDNVVFMDGTEAGLLREALKTMLHAPDSVTRMHSIIDRLSTKHLGFCDTSHPTAVYNYFKRLSTEICLSSFLDVNFDTSSELADQIVSLTTTHWHGIISVPLNLKIPMISHSTFAKALDAKVKLLHIINQRLAESRDSFANRMSQAGVGADTAASNHVLLFTSALVPKAIASLLTSFVLATAGQTSLLEEMRRDPTALYHALLETQRLWPPMVGGRRVAKKELRLQGYCVPAGYALVYMSHHAHRDPTVFDQPEVFLPDRWKDRNAQDRDRLFGFGGGPRDCIGQHVIWYILKRVCGQLLQDYDWEVPPDQNRQYKRLPVSRPRDSLLVQFRGRDPAAPPAHTRTECPHLTSHPEMDVDLQEPPS